MSVALTAKLIARPTFLAMLPAFALGSSTLSPRRRTRTVTADAGIDLSTRQVEQVEQEMLCKARAICSAVTALIWKRFLAEEAATRSRAEFLARYNRFARRGPERLREMHPQPGVSRWMVRAQEPSSRPKPRSGELFLTGNPIPAILSSCDYSIIAIQK